MSADIEILDGAVPLVKHEDWAWFLMFWEDEAEALPTDLTGRTVSAAIRWQGGEVAVAAQIIDPLAGRVEISLPAADTADIPLGRLSRLYVAVDTDTEAVVPVNAVVGLYLV